MNNFPIICQCLRCRLYNISECLGDYSEKYANASFGVQIAIAAQIENRTEFVELAVLDQRFQVGESILDSVVACISTESTVALSSGFLVQLVVDNRQQRCRRGPGSSGQMRILLTEPNG